MKKRLRSILLLCAAVVLALNGGLYAVRKLAPARELTQHTEVHFIDVGQGDASLLLSGGQAVLVDAGVPESGSTVVRYLQELGITELYAAVATHPHADHIGGMAEVIEAFPVGHFFMGRETANTSSFSRMLDALEARGVTPTIPSPGDELPLASGASLLFLGPDEDVPSTDMNDRSLITLFRAGAQDVLLMGDAEAAAENSLLAHYPQLCCDILKVGHHGSDSSSSPEFLSAVHPSVAVISCGADNKYGHPNPQTLANLSQAGTEEIHVTAEEGSVVIPLEPSKSSKENAA